MNTYILLTLILVASPLLRPAVLSREKKLACNYCVVTAEPTLSRA